MYGNACAWVWDSTEEHRIAQQHSQQDTRLTVFSRRHGIAQLDHEQRCNDHYLVARMTSTGHQHLHLWHQAGWLLHSEKTGPKQTHTTSCCVMCTCLTCTASNRGQKALRLGMYGNAGPSTSQLQPLIHRAAQECISAICQLQCGAQAAAALGGQVTPAAHVGLAPTDSEEANAVGRGCGSAQAEAHGDVPPCHSVSHVLLMGAA